MKKVIVIAIIWVCGIGFSYAQEHRLMLKGKFEHFAGSLQQKVVLLGYQGKQLQSIDTTTIDKDGNFVVSYPKSYSGMGQIQLIGTSGEIPILLSNNIITNQSMIIDSNGRIKFSANSPNEIYYMVQQNSDSYLARLESINKLSSYYNASTSLGQALVSEKKIVEQAQNKFLDDIDTLKGDVGYFIRLNESLKEMNTLLGAVQPPPISQLKAAQEQFENAVKFDDERLLHSGFVHRLLYSYYTLSAVLEGGYQHASNFLAEHLVNSPYKNTYIEEIIGVIQGQSAIAEYFSQKILETNQQCDDIKGNDIPGKIKRQLEQYTYLKVGAQVPDELLDNGKRISEITGKYKLIVFGASWCEHCQKEIPELRAIYADLKKQDIEVIGMDMDDNPEIHKIVSQANPWISHFVGRNWNAPITQHYYVYGTPTFFLVDKDLKIISKPKSVSELTQLFNLTNKI